MIGKWSPPIKVKVGHYALPKTFGIDPIVTIPEAVYQNIRR